MIILRVNSARAFFRPVCKQIKWQPEVTHDRKIVRWHTKPYMNNNNNTGWFFFGGYKNILPSILTILPSSSTRAILLTSRAIYSCIPLKAIQFYINLAWRYTILLVILEDGSNIGWLAYKKQGHSRIAINDEFLNHRSVNNDSTHDSKFKIDKTKFFNQNENLKKWTMIIRNYELLMKYFAKHYNDYFFIFT